MCEGDHECGTDRTLNNCHEYRDVYIRTACAPPRAHDPPSTPRSRTFRPTVAADAPIICGAVLLLLSVLLAAIVARRRHRQPGTSSGPNAVSATTSRSATFAMARVPPKTAGKAVAVETLVVGNEL